MNLLARVNRELGENFDLRRFAHSAFYNAPLGRIEVHLVSLARQTVSLGRHRFGFELGKTIHTEHSCKYSVEEFRALACAAGLRAKRVWKDPQGLFALFGLAVV